MELPFRNFLVVVQKKNIQSSIKFSVIFIVIFIVIFAKFFLGNSNFSLLLFSFLLFLLCSFFFSSHVPANGDDSDVHRARA